MPDDRKRLDVFPSSPGRAQIVHGWTYSHLYEFSFSGVTYSIPDPNWDFHCIDAHCTSLSSAIRDSGALSFKYDLGDGWAHSIKVEKIELGIPSLDYPFFIQGSSRLRAHQRPQLSVLVRDQYSRETSALMAVELDEDAAPIGVEEEPDESRLWVRK